jgi:hypothetical protein
VDRVDLQAVLVATMRAEAPLTTESALDCAAEVLQGMRERQEFEAWFEKNGSHLLRLVNGT